jgi:hypothetical protein
LNFCSSVFDRRSSGVGETGDLREDFREEAEASSEKSVSHTRRKIKKVYYLPEELPSSGPESLALSAFLEGGAEPEALDFLEGVCGMVREKRVVENRRERALRGKLAEKWRPFI